MKRMNFVIACLSPSQNVKLVISTGSRLGGGTLGISGWGCAAGSLKPLTFTRASSAGGGGGRGEGWE